MLQVLGFSTDVGLGILICFQSLRLLGIEKFPAETAFDSVSLDILAAEGAESCRQIYVRHEIYIGNRRQIGTAVFFSGIQGKI